MFAIIRRTIASKVVPQIEKQLIRANYSNHIRESVVLNAQSHNLNLCRYKSKTTKKQQQTVSTTDTDREKDEEEAMLDKHLKTATITVQSLRLDGVLKSGLGIARNKIETLFYESKIRLNGEKVQKKSNLIQIGDEIDIIKGPSTTNPDFLTVARLEIVDIIDTGETINLKVRRAKNLTIEPYKDS